MNTESSTQTSQEAAQLFGYDVLDASNNKIGTVDGVWVDDATNQLEFVAVKTGLLFGKDHIIPVVGAQIEDGKVRVPFDADTIKNGPSFDTDEELTPGDEEMVYNHYGIDRSTSESPSGLPTGQAGPTPTTIEETEIETVPVSSIRDTEQMETEDNTTPDSPNVSRPL